MKTSFLKLTKHTVKFLPVCFLALSSGMALAEAKKAPATPKGDLSPSDWELHHEEMAKLHNDAAKCIKEGKKSIESCHEELRQSMPRREHMMMGKKRGMSSACPAYLEEGKK